MPEIDWVLLVDWDGDRLFANANSDISTDIISIPSYTFGKNYASQVKGRSVAGRLSVVLRNDLNVYSRFNAGSPIAGLILPNRRVRLRGSTLAGPVTTQWEGNLDDIQPDPRDGGANRARLTALGPLAAIQAEKTYVDQRETILTGTAVTAILDADGFPAADRSIDGGQTTMKRWFVPGDFGSNATQKVAETESGLMRETKTGDIQYEDRHHRMKADHLTVQATYSDALGAAIAVKKVPERDPLKEVANIITAKVKKWTTSAEQTLWTLHETGADSPALGAGVTRVYVAHYPSPDAPPENSAGSATWIIPVMVTDFTANSKADGSGTDLTASISIGALVKGTDQVEIPVINGAAVTAFITALKIRGTVLVETNPATVQFTSSASKAKYQPRRYTLPAEFIPTTDEADDYCRYVAAQIDEPFPVLTAEFDANESQSAIQEVLDRDVSDKITLNLVAASGLGINEPFFVERIRVRVTEGGIVKYRAELSPATVTGLIIVLDTGPGLDTGILGY